MNPCHSAALISPSDADEDLDDADDEPRFVKLSAGVYSCCLLLNVGRGGGGMRKWSKLFRGYYGICHKIIMVGEFVIQQINYRRPLHRNRAGI